LRIKVNDEEHGDLRFDEERIGGTGGYSLMFVEGAVQGERFFQLKVSPRTHCRNREF
jgi:hypothetical protein